MKNFLGDQISNESFQRCHRIFSRAVSGLIQSHANNQSWNSIWMLGEGLGCQGYFIRPLLGASRLDTLAALVITFAGITTCIKLRRDTGS